MNMNMNFHFKIIFLVFFCLVSFVFIPCALAVEVDVSAIISFPEEEPELPPGPQVGGGVIFPRDITSPTNVSFFRAEPGDKEIFLSWVNPKDLDFSFVRIERSEEFSPLAPGKGLVVYKGRDQSFLDKDLINGKRYYYTIWAFDAAGNFSSGAIASAVPRKILPIDIAPPGVLPPKEIPIFLPPMPSPPPISIPKINLKDFFLFTKFIEIKPKESEIRVLPEFPLTFFISSEKFKQEIEIIQIVLDGQVFLLSLDKEAVFYRGTIKAPEKPGQYPLDIYIIYKNKTQDTIKAEVIVENFGQTTNLINKILNKFFKRLNLKEGIKGTQITLYWFNQKTDRWEIWPGQTYNQENPQITNEKGEYGFMVAPGKYSLLFNKKWYLSKTIKEFELENNIINFKVNLVPWWPLIVIGAPSAVLIVRFLLRLGKRKA